MDRHSERRYKGGQARALVNSEIRVLLLVADLTIGSAGGVNVDAVLSEWVKRWGGFDKTGDRTGDGAGAGDSGWADLREDIATDIASLSKAGWHEGKPLKIVGEIGREPIRRNSPSIRNGLVYVELSVRGLMLARELGPTWACRVM